MSGKKPYFPNNWKRYKDADDSDFFDHTFQEVMDWKVAGWELPSNVFCIIRTTDLKTRKVKEFVYQKESAAQARIKKLLEAKTHEFCITTHETQHYVGPAPEDDDEDDDLFD